MSASPFRTRSCAHKSVQRRIDIPNITVESAPLLSSILRMCTKYKIDRPCNDIIRRFRSEWPHKLVDHDAKTAALHEQQSRAAPYIVQNGVQVPNPQYDPNANEEDLIIHPGSVIALLRDCGYNTSEVLTPLFYALSRGTWQFGGAAIGHHIAPLSHADIERLIIGIERIRSQHADFVTQVPLLLAVPAPPHRPECGAGVKAYWQSLAPSMLKATNGSRQPVEDWGSIISQARSRRIISGHGACDGCERQVLAEMEKRRATLWADMAKHFEL